MEVIEIPGSLRISTLEQPLTTMQFSSNEPV